MSQYGFGCEYCDGTVCERIVERQPIGHHRGIVVLENVPIGVCDHCGAHYIAAAVIQRAESIFTSPTPPKRTLQIPLEAY